MAYENITNGYDLVYIPDFNAIADDKIRQYGIDLLNAGGITAEAVVDICIKKERQRIADIYKKDANLSKRFKMRTFETFNAYTPELKKAFEKAKKYADLLPEILEDGTNIIFEGHGCVGTGKTHLAYAIANFALNSGIPAKVVNATELVNAVSFSNLDKKLKQSLLDIPLLIIDDLGKECGYDWLLFELYGVLNHRYEHCKPTVITTEDTIQELRNHYRVKTDDGLKDRGKSIFSRICENVVIVSVQGDDYRLKRAVCGGI